MDRNKTPWAVVCDTHGQVFLTSKEYDRQLQDFNSFWTCPKCGCHATFDRNHFDEATSEIEQKIEAEQEEIPA